MATTPSPLGSLTTHCASDEVPRPTLMAVISSLPSTLPLKLQSATQGTVWERIAQAGIGQELVVGERLEEFHQIRLLLLGELEAADECALGGAVLADTGELPVGDGAPAGGVVVQHLFERRDAAVVHVGRRDRDVSQRRRFERPHVFRLLGEIVRAGVRRRITAVVLRTGAVAMTPLRLRGVVSGALLCRRWVRAPRQRQFRKPEIGTAQV